MYSVKERELNASSCNKNSSVKTDWEDVCFRDMDMRPEVVLRGQED